MNEEFEYDVFLSHASADESAVRELADRLKADEIPLVARIIGVADTFDAMTTNRPYQNAMTLDVVLDKMRSMAGSRFDPGVIDAFLAAVTAGDITPPQLGSSPQGARQEVS